MGRAERRREIRHERIDGRKNKLLISHEELGKIKEKERQSTSIRDIESLMTCIALAEHRLYGFGETRILRSLRCVDELIGGIVDGSATMEDYVNELKNDTGILIKFDN